VAELPHGRRRRERWCRSAGDEPESPDWAIARDAPAEIKAIIWSFCRCVLSHWR
jgi:hypothetical protein